MVSPKRAAPLSAAMLENDLNALSGRAMVPRPARTKAEYRRYRFSHLRTDGTVWEDERVAPSSALLDSAFSAFAHGTLLSTPSGPVSVQDLIPGMAVTTLDGKDARIFWVGSITMVPRHNPARDGARQTLFRVTPDTFGVGMPAGNLLLGPGARLLARPHALRDTMVQDTILTPCGDLVDGLNVIDVAPPRPVTVFHLVLERHAILIADGIKTESYHPGPGFERSIDAQTHRTFLSFFPFLRSSADFGALTCNRLPLRGV
ncbi:MAG: Hint domain-containing protein [Pseudomonadota bacterium]